VDVTVIAELFFGFSLGAKEKKNCRELEAFLNSPRVQVLVHDLETAEYLCFDRQEIEGQRPAHSHKRHLDRRQCNEAWFGTPFF